jgi:C4-dicarboxylate-specific signal transduction histidine kinase
MPAGGTLSVKAKQTDGKLYLEVSDTGEGIPEDVNILEPFVTTKKEGTGLGLEVIVRPQTLGFALCTDLVFSVLQPEH